MAKTTVRHHMERCRTLPYHFDDLTDYPIGEYYKPYNALFDACAEGRILILHPSTDDYKPVEEKRPDGSHRIRRSACVALNGLAEEI